MVDVELRDLLPVVFTSGRARQSGVTARQLAALREAGEVERLDHGLYRWAGASGDLDLLEVAARSDEATLCLATALARHGLTDEIPSVVDVALPRSRRPPVVRGPVRWHRFDVETFGIGRVVIDVDGLTLGEYGPERSICDAFRLRHLEGNDQAVVALKRWLDRRGAQPASLLRVARHFGPRAETPIRDTLEVLL